jgi:hypothetical protein
MSVWVDDLRDWGWRLGPSCHLFADTREELHLFAALIGMRAGWFQDNPRLWHYDLTARRRATAITMGAIEMSARDSVRRAVGRRPPPSVAAPERAGHIEQ